MILLAAGVVNRILGFIPRIALPRVIGAEGVGLYQMSYPFLMVVLTLVTGGIPLAVAKLVAEAESDGDSHLAKRILGMSLLFTSSLSLFFAIICMVTAPYLTHLLFTDTRVFYTFVCLAPIIPIVGVSAVFRGYFQGKQNMIPTALSQVTETLVRIVGMLTLAISLAPLGLEYAAAGAMIGTLLGEIAGMSVLLIQYARSRTTGKRVRHIPARSELVQTRKFVLRKVILVSLPVTANRLVGSFSYFFESVLTVQCLAIAGVATAAATIQYGSLQGMIIPVLMLPGVLTYSLSVSLIPTLSEASAKGDLVTIHKRLHQSLKLALLSGTPFAVFMYVLSDPICYYLYANSEIGVMLRMMAPAALFIYFQGPLQATLQALNHSGKALVNTLVGTIVKLTLIFVLASNPSFGILGAIMAIIVNIMLVTILHWNSVTKLLRFSFPSSEFFKVGLIAVGTGYICSWFMDAPLLDNPLLRFLTAVLAGTIFYLIGITVLKLVDADDLRKLPLPWKRWRR
ncbi:MAG: stage V sporulation protein B [Gorillibacterium sp.]|nr:stage V sporulation protein B [Gorillibacterium sp.]